MRLLRVLIALWTLGWAGLALVAILDEFVSVGPFDLHAGLPMLTSLGAGFVVAFVAFIGLVTSAPWGGWAGVAALVVLTVNMGAVALLDAHRWPARSYALVAGVMLVNLLALRTLWIRRLGSTSSPSSP